MRKDRSTEVQIVDIFGAGVLVLAAPGRPSQPDSDWQSEVRRHGTLRRGQAGAARPEYENTQVLPNIACQTIRIDAMENRIRRTPRPFITTRSGEGLVEWWPLATRSVLYVQTRDGPLVSSPATRHKHEIRRASLMSPRSRHAMAAAG
jgi:hypothetical protein